MQDTIILGNGTSKQIKTASLPNSYAEFKAMAENGNLFADIKLNADGCEVVGTPLNKLNLLTDETAEMLGGALNIDEAFQGTQKVINGIPVDLTGIYNGQMIGYDEESGKLLPMTSYKREIDLKDEYVDVIESGLYEYDPNGSSNFRIYFKKDDNETDTTLIFQFQNAFMFSEFSNFYIYFYNVGGNSRYDPNFYADIMLSKDENFETIDVTWHISASMDNYQNYSIVSLMGKYYIRIVLHSRRQYAGIYNLKLS